MRERRIFEVVSSENTETISSAEVDLTRPRPSEIFTGENHQSSCYQVAGALPRQFDDPPADSPSGSDPRGGTAS